MATKRTGLALLVIAAACGDADPASRWQGTVDTLADGRVVASNPSTGLWDSLSSWSLVEELRIGTAEGTGPELFGAVAGLDVDAYGRIWVLDRNAKDVRVFDHDGTHIRTLGRLGSGPGEFRDPIGIALDRSGQVWIVDPGNARYAIFDTAGSYLTAQQRKLSGYSVPWRGGFDEQDRLLEVAFARRDTEYRSALIRFDEQLEPADTFLVPPYEAEQYQLSNPQGTVTAGVPYAPSLIWRADANGSMWSGVNGEYRLYQHTFAGDTVRELSRTYEHVPVTSAERDTAVSRMSWFTRQGGTVDPSRIPDRKPAYTNIDIAPDDHLWISVTPESTDGAAPFDIFDPDGRYLGQLRPPLDLRRGLVFRDEHVYGVTTDSLGVQYVVRLRLQR